MGAVFGEVGGDCCWLLVRLPMLPPVPCEGSWARYKSPVLYCTTVFGCSPLTHERWEGVQFPSPCCAMLLAGACGV